MAVRPSVNRAGLLKADDKEFTVILRDVTDVGATVRLLGSGIIPDRVQLVAPMEKLDHACVVEWRRGRDCGLAFEGVAIAADMAEPEAALG